MNQPATQGDPFWVLFRHGTLYVPPFFLDFIRVKYYEMISDAIIVNLDFSRCNHNWCVRCRIRITNSRTGFATYMTTDTPTHQAISTTASLHPSRAAFSLMTFLPLSSLPAPVNTQRLTSLRWMCTVFRQILPHSCAKHHQRRRALWESQT